MESEKYVETKSRARFFQTVQAWPLDDDLDFEGWLSNFDKGEERELACHVLDFFNHYSSKMVIQLFKTSVANSGYVFAKHFKDWKHDDFENRCLYSFIPGETLNPTDSGHIFTRILRDEMRIPEDKIVNYQIICDILDSSTEPRPIILVDDFVGSGQQVLNAWLYNTLSNGKTLSEMCLNGNHCVVYTPLFVNQIGYDTIMSDCEGLNVSPTHILTSEYNLFDKDCICWKGDVDLFRNGTKLLLDKSNLLGIPSTGGADTRDQKGFYEQGLAISFHHGAPDAIPAIFYWNSDNWKPLIRKSYAR
jgi:hypothetical protein